MSNRVDDSGPGPGTLAGIGIFLIAIAVVIAFDAQRMPPAPTVGAGPAAAMRIVAALVGALGVAHGVVAWRARSRGFRGGEASGGNLAALGWVLAALIGLIVILEAGGGFIVGSTWLFVATARAFGEKLSPKSFAIGIVLSGLAWLFFTRVLSLSLPGGPLERLLQ